MAAAIALAPPDVAFSGNEIWVKLSTDLITAASASVQLSVTGAGPNAGETLSIAWAGKSLVFTTAAAPNISGLQLPTKGALSLADYAALLAEHLRQNEILNDDFLITLEAPSGGAQIIKIAYRAAAALDITASGSLSNVTITVTDSAGWTTAENLRAELEVWSDSGNPNTDKSLLKIHAPYDFSTSEAKFNLQDGFSGLKSHLPPASSIPPTDTPASAHAWGLATDAVQKFYFRYADKFGTSPVAQAMKKSPQSYLAQLGSRSGDSPSLGTVPQLAHNWRRFDGKTWWKPVSDQQPDFVYWRAIVGGNFTPVVHLWWSNGGETNYTPFDTPLALEEGKFYFFATGFRQLKLQLAPPPATGAYIVRYRVGIVPGDAEGTWYLAPLYEVKVENSDWGIYLLYETGLGGMETVWLRGKSTSGYEVSGIEAQQFRDIGWTVEKGDFDNYAQSGRQIWEVSTGFNDDSVYLEGLRQLPLAKCWMADLRERRWKRVIVEAKKIEGVAEDDRDLHEMTFTVRAAWQDESFNQ